MTGRYFGHAPEGRRSAAVQRYLTSDLTLEEVGAQFGTTRGNVWRWLRAAGSQALGKKSKRPVPPTTPDGRSSEEKFRLLVEASKLSESELGESLRREGLRDGDLERFKAEAMGGLSGAVHSPADQRRIQELERVNAKQEKRLREAEVLLELQKSPRALGGKGRHDEGLRTEIISLLDEAVARGARGEAGLA